MENKPIHQKSSEIKKLFVREFPEFKHEFTSLSEAEEFEDMLNDYTLCEYEISRLSDIHNKREVYIQLKYELKDEILNYIFRHIKNQSAT